MFDMCDQRYFAVIVGSCDGMAVELARALLSNGFDVLIANQNETIVQGTAQELAGSVGEVLTWAGDLGREDHVDRLYAAIRLGGRPVDVLCINPGLVRGRSFTRDALTRELSLIDASVRGVVQLTKLVRDEMAARGAGRIMLSSYPPCTIPGPLAATFWGTRAFLRSFGEALRKELKGTGVSVTVVMPEVKDVERLKRARRVLGWVGLARAGDDVAASAQAGFHAMMAARGAGTTVLKRKVLPFMAAPISSWFVCKTNRSLPTTHSARGLLGRPLA